MPGYARGRPGAKVRCKPDARPKLGRVPTFLPSHHGRKTFEGNIRLTLSPFLGVSTCLQRWHPSLGAPSRSIIYRFALSH